MLAKFVKTFTRWISEERVSHEFSYSALTNIVIMKNRKDTFITMDIMVTADCWPNGLTLYSAMREWLCSSSAGSIIFPAARTADGADSPRGSQQLWGALADWHAITIEFEQTLPATWDMEWAKGEEKLWVKRDEWQRRRESGRASEASVFSCERKSEETAEDNLLCDRPPLVCNGICIRPHYLFTAKSFNKTCSP